MLPLSDEKIICCGCSACSNICSSNAIDMKEDNEGFLYPVINGELCANCGLCMKVCPQLNKEIKIKMLHQPTVLAAWNSNDEIRKESSSGGIFTALAEDVLKNNGLVVGAGFSENFEVIDMIISEKNELYRLRGSKYVQSKIGDVFVQVRKELNNGKRVLFSGTPCQVSGLYTYLGRDYENLITCDLVCHGSPSPLVFGKYLEYQSAKSNSKVKKVSFRDKEIGWKNYSVSIEFENRTLIKIPFIKDYFMKAFLKNLSLRPSCYQCNFKGLPRAGDITLGDFWGINIIRPEIDDNRGISLILLNTQKALGHFENIKEQLSCVRETTDNASKYNPCLVRSVEKPNNRSAFWKDLNVMDFERLAKKYFNDKFNIALFIKSIVRKFIKRLKI